MLQEEYRHIGTDSEKQSDIEKQPKRPSNPHRPWSGKWTRHAWAEAVEFGKWPRLIYGGLGVIIIGAWIGIMLQFASSEVQYQKNNIANPIPRNGTAPQLPLILQGTLKKFDPVDRVLTVEWSAKWLMRDPDDENNITFVDSGSGDGYTYELGIWRDQVGVFDNTTILDPLWGGMFRVDNTSAPRIATVGLHTWDSFDTEIDFSQAIPDSAWKQPQFGYPWDQWTGNIVFVANLNSLAKNANLTGFYVLEISGITLADSTLNWRISQSFDNTCSADKDVSTGCDIRVTFTGRRPPLVIFSTMVAVLVNWLSTLAIFIITCEWIILQRPYVLEGTDMFGVCFSALFALPTVRSLLPGAPDFGAVIDLVGIIPNVIIIALCTIIIAIHKVRIRRPKEE